MVLIDPTQSLAFAVAIYSSAAASATPAQARKGYRCPAWNGFQPGEAFPAAKRQPRRIML